MNVDILVQKIDEDYSFTTSGELTAYFHTVKKVLLYYMIKEQGLNQSTAQQKLYNLKGFLSKNFQQLDDYFNKIDLLAQYIGETDPVTLSSFLGKRFLPVLEQVKQQLLKREISKYRNYFENPLRTPSHNLLDELNSLFVASKPLVWPPPKKEGEAATISGFSSKGSSQPLKDVTKDTQVEKASQTMPGVILLELYEKDFTEAKPLSLPLPSELPHKKVNAVKEEMLDTLGQQVSFKEYALLSNKVAQFFRNKDNQGYQLWLSQLEPRFNVCIYLNQLIAKEGKDQKIDWTKQISSLSDQLDLEINRIKKIKHEIGKYQNVLTSLRKLLQKLPTEVHQLYSQLIILLDEKDTLENKQVALKMILLQVTDSSLKESIYTKVCLLIDILHQ